MIRVTHLDFQYFGGGEFRLAVPAFSVAPGEKVALTGASGSGKSTLISLLCGLERCEKGAVEVMGEDLGSLGDREREALRREKLGMVFQELELIEYLTVRENILLNSILGRRESIPEDILHSLAQQLGIGELLDRFPSHLSQGERQRAAACRALVYCPSLVIADEPTGNLDPTSSRALLELVCTTLLPQKGSLVMVTHDHSLLGYFDRVVDMSEIKSSS